MGLSVGRLRLLEKGLVISIEGAYKGLHRLMATGKIFVGRTVGLPNVLRGWCHFLGVEDFVAADHTFSIAA